MANKGPIYRVLLHSTPESMEKSAAWYMARDWQLRGGLSVAVGPDKRLTYAQAVVKLPNAEKSK